MSTDFIDRIVQFIAERDPAFPAHIQGAAAEEIERLEQAMGKPIDEGYRRFLERMGRGSSWLKLGAGRFDIDSVTRFYEHYGDQRCPEGHELIGRGEGDPRYDFYLQSDGEDEQRVISYEVPYAPERVIRTAGSLPQWIGDRALQVLRRKGMAYQKKISDPDGRQASRLMEFDELMARLGGPALWYSNDWMRTYETRDAVVAVFEVPGEYRMIASLSAETEAEMNRIFPEVRGFVRGTV